MVTYTHGNPLEADAKALVNAVNGVGVMGKGIALALRQRFPTNMAAYAVACKAGEVQPGRMVIPPKSASCWRRAGSSISRPNSIGAIRPA